MNLEHARYYLIGFCRMFQKAQSELFIIDKFSSLNLGLNRVNYFLRQPNNQEKQPAKPRLLQEAFHPRLNVA